MQTFFPYITTTGQLKSFLATIQSTGIPEKVTQNTLVSLGLPFTHFRSRMSSHPGGSEDLGTLKAAPEDLDTGHAVVFAS